MAIRNFELDKKIINAANKEFLKEGFKKASLRRIAQTAGITTGALYTRYKNKGADIKWNWGLQSRCSGI